MTKREKKKLVLQATKLYTLGWEVDNAQSALQDLVSRGFAYDSADMLKAVNHFNLVN